MAVLMPRRFPPSTLETDLTTHRAEASTDGPDTGEAARPLHMSLALSRMSSAPLSANVARAQRGASARTASHVASASLVTLRETAWGRQRRSCSRHEADNRSGHEAARVLPGGLPLLCRLLCGQVPASARDSYPPMAPQGSRALRVPDRRLRQARETRRRLNNKQAPDRWPGALEERVTRIELALSAWEATALA